MNTTNQNPVKAQSRPEQSHTRSSLPRINFRLRRSRRAMPTQKVLTVLRRQAPRFWEVAEVVGKWVWITFTEKQPREVTMTLAELGFHWNHIRQCWQHPCGTLAQRSPRDPRIKYGSYFAADMELI